MKVKLLTAFVVAFIFMVTSVSFGATITYQYDDLHRLTRVERTEGKKSFLKQSKLQIFLIPETRPFATDRNIACFGL